MDNEIPTTSPELNTALLELNLLHTSPEISAVSPVAGQSIINSFRTSYIVPPNTPVKFPIQVNPRYISKIYSSPRRAPNRVPPMRMRPYYIPERPRTKSENADPSSALFQETRTIVDEATVNYSATMMDTCDNIQSIETATNSLLNERHIKIRQKILFKKSKSLEDVRIENSTPKSAASSHEMEFMSSRIQKLRVQD